MKLRKTRNDQGIVVERRQFLVAHGQVGVALDVGLLGHEGLLLRPVHQLVHPRAGGVEHPAGEDHAVLAVGALDLPAVDLGGAGVADADPVARQVEVGLDAPQVLALDALQVLRAQHVEEGAGRLGGNVQLGLDQLLLACRCSASRWIRIEVASGSDQITWLRVAPAEALRSARKIGALLVDRAGVDARRRAGAGSRRGPP